MKKFLFVAFVALMTMSMSSCKKEVSLPGTNWKGTGMQTTTIDGENYTITIKAAVHFTDETNGTIQMAFTAEEGEYIESGSASGTFTYTFADNQGSLKGTMVDTDGESVPIQSLMTYNYDNGILSFTFEGILIEMDQQ